MSQKSPKTSNPFVPLAQITKPFGIKGGVKVRPYNEDSDALLVGTKVRLSAPKREDKILTISEIKGGWRFFFEDHEAREDAENLVGYELSLKRSELPKIEDDEFYLGDLVGAKVINIDNKLLGTVTGFSDTNAHVLVEVKNQNGDIVECPLINPILVSVDEEAGVLTLDPPLGLFEAVDD